MNGTVLIARVDAALWRFTRRLALWAARKLVDAANDRLHAAEESFRAESLSRASEGGDTHRLARGKVGRAATEGAAASPRKTRGRRDVTVPAAACELAQRLLSSGLSAAETGSALQNMGYSTGESIAAVS